ncbi:MAG: putative integrase [Desulfurococcales archaeon]|nr:putative integrase [Desulfurococcales archaeon]
MGRKYVVKRITKELKDRSIATYYYVYEQYRIDGRVKTKYIAKLDEVIEFYVKNVVDRPGFEPGTSRVQAQSPITGK